MDLGERWSAPCGWPPLSPITVVLLEGLQWVDPYTLQVESFPVPLKLGEVLLHNYLPNHNSSDHPTGVQASTWWQCNQSILVCCCFEFDQWELRSGLSLEWIHWSNCLCKIYQSRHCARFTVGPANHLRLGPVYNKASLPMRVIIYLLCVRVFRSQNTLKKEWVTLKAVPSWQNAN